MASTDSGAPLANTGLVQPDENAKLQQLHAHAVGMHTSAGGKCPWLQMQTGVAYMDDDHSLKAGTRGPTLLEDQVMREKINHFDHERIPERVVHARGTGAHGFFELYKSQAHLSSAAIFNETGVKTPLFMRFSTVLGSAGAMDTARDVRGFAIKMYTKEGNWDFVGNNIPVFFIQDSIKFPDIIHAGKPEPQLQMPQGATAHDNFWDFISWTPESAHMITWAMSDRTIPRSYRMMQGFGVHTFALINAQGKRTFVKFHWRPILGVHGLVWDESQKLGGVDPDFHRRDLYEAIENGDFPEWELGFQLVKEEDEHKFDFDILDSTKIIPEELVPVEYIGKMTLNRLPTDFFAEVEQVAFCTQNIVPGIDFSDDPLLSGRNFSYLDTQLSRLGSVNFNQLPINRPLHRPINNQRDGHMQQNIHTDTLNYYPNRLSAVGKAARAGQGAEQQPLSVAEQKKNAFQTYSEKVAGVKERVKAPKFLEFYEQASLFFNSMTPFEQQHMLDASSFELSKVMDLGVRERIRDMWNNIEPSFAAKLAKKIGVAPPGKPTHVNSGKKSAFLSMINSPYSPPDNIKTRKVGAIIGDGFRASELEALRAALKAEGAMLKTVGVRRGKIFAEGSAGAAAGADEQKDGGAGVEPDFTIFNCKSVIFDSVVVVGGTHVPALQAEGAVSAFLAEALKHHKAVAVSADAVALIQFPCQLAGIKVTDGSATVDDQAVVTGKFGGDVIKAFIGEMKKHRCWERNVIPIPA